jgi:hypothetical protein
MPPRSILLVLVLVLVLDFCPQADPPQVPSGTDFFLKKTSNIVEVHRISSLQLVLRRRFRFPLSRHGLGDGGRFPPCPSSAYQPSAINHQLPRLPVAVRWYFISCHRLSFTFPTTLFFL